ncbi:hypothetical protein GEMRC1_011882 [Eukaryota sp. GEM-RC1]
MFENHNDLTFTSSNSFSIKDFNFVKGTVTVVPDSSLLLTDFTWIKGDFSGDITVSNSITAVGAEVRSFTDGTFTLSASTVDSMAVTFATSSVLKVPFTKNVIFSNSIQQFNDELFKGLLIVEGFLTLQDDEGDISTIKNLKVKSTGHLHCDDCEIDSLTWSKGKLSGQLSLCSDIDYGDDKSNLYLLDNSELTLKAVQFVSLTVECKSMCTLKVPEESTVEFAEFVEFLSDSTDSIFINDGITTFDVNSNGFNSELMFENHNDLTFTSSSSFSINDFNFVKGTVTVVPDSSLLLTDFTWIEGDYSGDITVSNSITAVGAEVRSFTDGTFTLSASTVDSMAVTFATSSVLKVPFTKNVIFSNSIQQFNDELFKGLLIVEGFLTLQDDEGDISTIKNLKVKSTGHLHCDDCEIDSLTWSKGKLSGQLSLCSDIDYGDDKSNLYLLDNSELNLKAVQFVSLTVECKSMCTLKVPEESTVEFADSVQFLSDSTDSVFINEGMTIFDVNTDLFHSQLKFENYNDLTFISLGSISIEYFNFTEGTVTVKAVSLSVENLAWNNGNFSGNLTISKSVHAVNGEFLRYSDGFFDLLVDDVASLKINFLPSSVLRIPVDHTSSFSESSDQFNSDLFHGQLQVVGSLTLDDTSHLISLIKSFKIINSGKVVVYCDLDIFDPLVVYHPSVFESIGVLTNPLRGSVQVISSTVTLKGQAAKSELATEFELFSAQLIIKMTGSPFLLVNASYSDVVFDSYDLSISRDSSFEGSCHVINSPYSRVKFSGDLLCQLNFTHSNGFLHFLANSVVHFTYVTVNDNAELIFEGTLFVDEIVDNILNFGNLRFSQVILNISTLSSIGVGSSDTFLFISDSIISCFHIILNSSNFSVSKSSFSDVVEEFLVTNSNISLADTTVSVLILGFDDVILDMTNSILLFTIFSVILSLSLSEILQSVLIITVLLMVVVI